MSAAASRFAHSTQIDTSVLRVATYNIHKGVRGVGPRKRLEIHNLGLAIEALDADIVCLQEVRLFHHREARRFDRTWFGWPEGGQADFLAPEGYGEIVGGGERETNLEWLVDKIHEHQLPMEAFEWYLDLRRYGSVPHSGFGLGLERLVAWVCKLPHVRETIPFPRMYGRIAP